MAKREERVLLYQFPTEYLMPAQEVFRAHRIRVQVLEKTAWREKIGFLLGYKGYRPADGNTEEPFDFPHEVVLFEHIQGKRLTKVLASLEAVGIPRIIHKSVITPYNTLWTLRYLCEHMQREHGAGIYKAE